MTFRLPWVLWLLVSVPVLSALLVYGYRARKRSLSTFGLDATLAPLLVDKSPRVRAVRGVLCVLGVFFAVLSWAGPQYGSHTRVLKKRGIDVVIALDFSKSMLARDVRPSRIERAKAELTRFLGELTGDRVGVVAFAGDTMEFPMTTDYAAVELFLRDLGPYDMPVGGTAIGRALTASGRLLERASKPKQEGEADAAEPERSRVVILMTDGEDHEGNPVEAATQLAATGARVFVVGIGSSTGEPIPTFAPDGTWTGYLRDEKGSPVLSALSAENEKQLAEIANVGKGTYFRAKQGSVGVDEIRKLMKGMKQAESKARRVSIAEDRYLLALLPAFLLLLIEGVLPDGLARKKRKTQPRSAAVAALLFFSVLGASTHALAWEPFRSKSSDVERGNEALKKGDAAAALEAYQTARKKLPNEPGVEVNRGLALAASGKLDEAREAFQSVARGKASKELRAAANYNLGLSFIKQAEAAAKAEDLDKAQGFLRESIDALKSSLRDGPGNRDAAWNLELARRQLVEVEKKREEKKKQEEQEKKEQEQKDQEQKSDQQQNQDGQQGDQQEQDGEKPDEQPKQDQPSDQEQEGQKDDKSDQEQHKPENQDGEKKEQEGQQEPKPQPSQEQAQPQQGKEGQPDEAQPQKALPQHMQKALDALSEGEQSLEKYRARQRATQRPRRIEKDW